MWGFPFVLSWFWTWKPIMLLLLCETEKGGKYGLATIALPHRLKGSWKLGRPQLESAQAGDPTGNVQFLVLARQAGDRGTSK